MLLVEATAEEILSNSNIKEVYEISFKVDGASRDFISSAIKHMNENKKSIYSAINVGSFLIDSNDGVNNSLLFGIDKKIVPIQLEESLSVLFSENVIKGTSLENSKINSISVKYIKI